MMRLWSRSDSLQRKINGFILLISCLLLALSVFTATIARNNYEEAKRLEFTSQVTRMLAQAAGDLALERGRLNVVLRSPEPISDDNRAFIAERRRLSDRKLREALRRLTPLYPGQAADLERAYAAVNILRQQADAEAGRSYYARQPGFAPYWLQQTTDFLYQLENVLLHLGRCQVDTGRYFLYHQLMLDSLRFRQLAGHHASVLTTVLVQPDAGLGQEDKIAFIKTQADSLWAGIEMQAAYLADPGIIQTKEEVAFHYYQLYRPEQERLLAVPGRVDQEAVARLQQLAIAAFNTIFLQMDAIESEMQEYVNFMTVEAKWLLIAGIAQFIACLLLVIFCLSYFQRRLFRPLQRIIEALERLGRNEEISLLREELERPDEIGRINNGVWRLQQSIIEERRLTAENEQLAMTDFLTGCLNKRGFYLRARAELNRAARENTPIAFVFSDLDDLKYFNDHYGHLVGDEAVKHFAACVQEQCRPYDLIGRFGGDEFVFCFPRADEEQALKIVNRIQIALDSSGFQIAGTDLTLPLRVSFGLISGLPGEDCDIEWFINQADMALYKAKQSGKNCVMLSGGEKRTFC